MLANKLERGYFCNVMEEVALYRLRKPATLVWLSALVVALTIMAGCGRGGHDATRMPWHSGNAEVDSLLDLADHLVYARQYDEARLLHVLARADSLAFRGDDPRLRPASLFVRLLRNSILEAPAPAGVPLNPDSALDRDVNPYLHARLSLLMSQYEENLEKKTDMLFGILPDFVDAADSMRVVETLYELNMAYGKVWDTDTQIDYIEEILKYVPDSLPELRGVMKSNVVRLQRTRTDSVSYLASLDSLRAERQLMNVAPALGVIVYADLYRLRGRVADLDTAARFLDRLEIRHDSERVYDVQLLDRTLSLGDIDSAAVVARRVSDRLSDEDTALDMESMIALVRFYRQAGMSETADSMSRRLQQARRSADAFERAITLSRLNADRRIADFRRYNEERKHNTASVWIVVAVVLLVVIPPVVYMFVLLRRRQRESDSRLKSDLDNTRRRLTVAEMRSAEKDRALSGLIQDIDSLPADPEARAEAIRRRLKLHLTENDEWERFTAVFTEMRPGFVENLKSKYPQLTKGDVRLCCLLEMGLDTKHMAQLLMIRPESVKKHRQRLRAKFGIGPDVSWAEFFSRI